jgi:hypothetical protein
LISLSVNKAGTIPIIDMTFHTPVVYIFSVLEVNIAIIAASIPIFWPVFSSMAINKIWVVNEIEVRVETTSRGASLSTNGEIDDAEQGQWTKLDSKDDYGGKSNIVAKSYERPATQNHKHKQSNTSSLGRTLGFESNSRLSQESTRNLCRIPSGDLSGRNASLSQSQKSDWFAEVDRQNTGQTTTNIEKSDIPLTRIKTRDSRR